MRKVVIVTGASSGLGKETAIILSKDYDLAICGRKEEKLEETIKLLDPSCHYFAKAFDMQDNDEIKAFCLDVKKHFDHINALINNAGANLKKELVKDITPDLLQQMMQLNCYAPLSLIQSFYPELLKEKDSHIVNVLSSCCLYSNETVGSYTCSKDAFNGLAKILVKEAKKDGIHVSNIYPGGIDTEFRAEARPNYLRPKTVAKAIEFCLENDDGSVQDLVLRPHYESNF
jgi:short-subunit dehydrogenase